MLERLDKFNQWFFDSNDELIQAIRNQSLDQVNVCIQRGMDVNKNLKIDREDHNSYYSTKQSPLTLAAKYGNRDIIIAIIKGNKKGGADVNRKDHECYYTPLMMAAKYGQIDAIKALIEHDANVNYIRKEDNFTPLMVAVEFGHIDAVKTLIEYGANVKFSGMNGTAMDQALRWGHASIMKLFFEINGFDTINYPTRDGNTPLMNAASSGHVDAVKVLLEYGADPTIMNRKGRTAEMFAVQYPEIRVAIRQTINQKSVPVSQLNKPSDLGKKQMEKTDCNELLKEINTYILLAQEQCDSNQLVELKNLLLTHITRISQKEECQSGQEDKKQFRRGSHLPLFSPILQQQIEPVDSQEAFQEKSKEHMELLAQSNKKSNELKVSSLSMFSSSVHDEQTLGTSEDNTFAYQ